jgi:hypothetical protein
MTQSPFEDPEVVKIATLKQAKAVDILMRGINEEQAHKKSELASRGLSQSGALITVMLNLGYKRVEGILRAQNDAWKEALSETGYPLTSNHLRHIADEAVKCLENAPNQIMASVKHQAHGMANIVDQMAPAIEQEVYSIRGRFKRDSEIDIAKATVAERNQGKSMNTISPPIARQDFSFFQDTDLRRIVERDYSELQSLDANLNAKSVLIMSGAIIEGLLLDATVKANILTKEKATDMTLQQLLTAATKHSIVREDRLGNAVRNYRNLIHPAREIRDNLHFTGADATLSRAAVDVIIQEIRKFSDKHIRVDNATPPTAG